MKPTPHILIVDSSPARQHWFKDALASLPECRIDTALTSHGALLHMRSRRYDLVLLDDFLGSDSKTCAQLVDEVLSHPAGFFRPQRVWVHAERIEQAAGIAARLAADRIPVLQRPFSTLSLGASFMDKVTPWLDLRPVEKEKQHV